MTLITPLSAEEMTAILLSLRVSLVAVGAALPFAVAAAWALSRKRFPGQFALNVLVHLPLVLPPVATGLALLLLFGRAGPLGQILESMFGVSLAFRWTGAALAAGIMALPLMVRAIRLSIEAVSTDYLEEAAVMGASRWQMFRHVVLPLALPGVIAGAVLGYAKALGEFGATITFVSNIPGETQTIPAAIYSALQVPGGEWAALRLTFVSVAISVAALALSEGLARRQARRA